MLFTLYSLTLEVKLVVSFDYSYLNMLHVKGLTVENVTSVSLRPHVQNIFKIVL